MDDAVLSCGGAIRRQIGAGEPVLVVNVFAGRPDYRRLSPIAAELHAQWGFSDDPVGARRREDQAALDRLGAQVEYWDYFDCIYRGDGERFFYPTEESLFGRVDPAEAELLGQLALDFARLRAEHPDARFYAPLALGDHVDHQIVRAAAIALHRLGTDLLFYEDLPYMAQLGEQEEVRQMLEEAGWKAEVVPIDVEAKIQDIAGYTSQIAVLFGNLELMAEQMRGYAASAAPAGGFAERFWRL
jgi:LmbE family N-acetylglucosaminyl deacetylase